MTYQDIYTKFMIEYDKANVTSSYPMLTEFEVATILDRAYLALIWQKVSGNNTRRVPFEYDQKAISDIQPLIRTVKHNLTVPTTRIASNVVATNLPADCLSFIDLVLEQNKSDYPLDELHQRNVPTTLIPHNTVENFLVTPYNMPWIKKPVCFLENNTVNIAYDTISLGNLGSDDKALITYIKQPISFVKSLVNYVPTDEDYQNLLTQEDAYKLFVRKWQDVYTGDGPSETIPTDPGNQGGSDPQDPSSGDSGGSSQSKQAATWTVRNSTYRITSNDQQTYITTYNPDNIEIHYNVYHQDSQDIISITNNGRIIPMGNNGTAVVIVSSNETDSFYAKSESVNVTVDIEETEEQLVWVDLQVSKTPFTVDQNGNQHYSITSSITPTTKVYGIQLTTATVDAAGLENNIYFCIDAPQSQWYREYRIMDGTYDHSYKEYDNVGNPKNGIIIDTSQNTTFDAQTQQTIANGFTLYMSRKVNDRTSDSIAHFVTSNNTVTWLAENDEGNVSCVYLYQLEPLSHPEYIKVLIKSSDVGQSTYKWTV